MALNAFVGSFNLGTGVAATTVEVTDPGFTPKVLILWWNGITASTDTVFSGNARPGFGWTTGTTSRAAISAFWQNSSGSGDSDRQSEGDQCVIALDNTGGNAGRADLSSFDANGFTMVIDTQFANDHRVSYLALGGDDLTDTTTGNFSMLGSAGNQVVTGVGFTPDAVFFMGINRDATDTIDVQGHQSLSVFSAADEFAFTAQVHDNQPTTATGGYLFAGECYAHMANPTTAMSNRASFVRMDADGFTINWDESGTATFNIFYLAIRGPAVSVGSVTTRTDGNDIVKTGFGFSPDAAMFISHGFAASTQDTPDAGAHVSVGAFSATDERSAQTSYSRDAQGTSQTTRGIEHDAVYMRVDNSNALDAAMDIKTIGSDGFTLVMDNTDSGAHAVGYIAFGVVAGGGINTSGTLNYRRRRRMAT